MFEYRDEILAAFDKGGGTKSSAAPLDLFKIDEDSTKLGTDKAVAFHNLVVKTLFAPKRARPDTCTSIAFLTTRVRIPDKDDWRKLVHLMKCFRGTRTLPLILSADGTGVLKWCFTKESFISRAWDYLNNRLSSLLLDNLLENCINHQYDHRRI
jgi:hypothetical protein